MKFSFKSKVRMLLVFLILVYLLQGVLLHVWLGKTSLPAESINNAYNIIYIGMFIAFFFSLILYFYIPVFIKNSTSDILRLLKDIAKGNYALEVDWQALENKVDKEFAEILQAINEMLVRVGRFDTLKKAKIIENRNRLTALLSLAETGFMVFDFNGDIAYANDSVITAFEGLKDAVNIANTNYNPDIENSIKKYALNVLHAKSRQEPQQFFIPKLKKHITIKSAIVKSDKGKPAGFVLAITNINPEKAEKKKTTENAE